MAPLKDYLELHFLVVLWGFTAILGLLISIPPVEMVFYRTLFSFLGLGIILYIRRISINISKRDFLIILFNGAVMALHWILFFGSARVSNASVSLAGFATLALWTSFLEPFAQRKRVKPHEVILSIAIILGLYVIFRFEFDYAYGLVLGVLSAFLGAIFTVVNSRLVKRIDPFLIMFLEMAAACAVIVLSFPAYRQWLAYDQTLNLVINGSDFFYLLVLAMVCTVYAYTMGVKLLKRISAFSLNLTINLEPVYGIVLALIIFGESERMSAGFYWGTLIILVAIFSHPLIEKYNYHKESLWRS